MLDKKEETFDKYEQAAAFLKLLANPNRLAVLCNLQGERRNVTELAGTTGLPQAAMSNQLALLRGAGLINCEVKHRERLYYIADERVNETIALLYSFFCAEDENGGEADWDEVL